MVNRQIGKAYGSGHAQSVLIDHNSLCSNARMLIIRSHNRQIWETVFCRSDGEGVQARGWDVARARVEDSFLVLGLESFLGRGPVQVRGIMIRCEIKVDAVLTRLVVYCAATGA
jgi:hypothetical protein